jgi:Undecaprenyl-phosphate glucose phosphotransferase
MAELYKNSTSRPSLNNLILLSDLLLLNAFFALVYLFIYEPSPMPSLGVRQLSIFFLAVNLSFFVSTSFFRPDLSKNILPVEKVVQHSVCFTFLYGTVTLALLSLFFSLNFPFWYCLAVAVGLVVVYTLWSLLLHSIIRTFRKKGRNNKNIIIIGGGHDGESIFVNLNNGDYGYHVLGYFDNTPDAKLGKSEQKHLGRFSDVINYIEQNRVDEIYCSVSGQNDKDIQALIVFSEKNMIRFYIIPEFYKYVKRRFSLHFIDTIPVLSVRQEPLQSHTSRFIKRAFDIAFSSLVLLIVFPPIFLIFGTIVKLTDGGSFFFSQNRNGINGEVFKCHKFRSMRKNKDADSKSATKNDTRITPIGRFMRKTNVDELPQFFNVLKGEMSIVGPRPHMEKHTEEYSALIEKYMVRHLVKPGITGWAQTTGSRGEITCLKEMEDRVKKDVWYLENWTFFLDLRIIVDTVLNVFRGEEKAY